MGGRGMGSVMKVIIDRILKQCHGPALLKSSGLVPVD